MRDPRRTSCDAWRQGLLKLPARLAPTIREDTDANRDVRCFQRSWRGWDFMAVSLSWKVGGAVAAVIVAALAWHGFTLYMAGRHADELTRDVARNAALQAQQAQAQAQQRSAQLTATLQHQREDLANTYRQVNEDAAEYKVAQARREEQRRQEELRVQATFRLGPNQKCAGGIVINRSGSSFTPAVGKSGQPIHCTGDTADEPLR